MKTKSNSFALILALLFGAVLPVPGENVPAASGILAEKRIGRPGSEVTIPILLRNSATDAASGLGNVNFEITYDPNVVAVAGRVARGNIYGSDVLFEANAKETGRIRIGFAGKNGVTQSGTVAQVPFKIVGQPGQETELALKVIQSQTPNGQSTMLRTTNGRITIPLPVQDGGHVSRDGTVTPLGYGQGGHIPAPGPHATQQAAAPTSPSQTTGTGVSGRRGADGRCGLAGEWEYKHGSTTSKWVFTPNKAGGYDAQQYGYGQVNGPATVDGSKLRIEWRGYTNSGTDEYELDELCSSGSGKQVVRGGDFAGEYPVSIRRLTVAPELGMIAADKPKTAATPPATAAHTPAITSSQPGAIISQPMVPGGIVTVQTDSGTPCDLTGDWEVKTEGWSASPWTFTLEKDGRYSVRQQGYSAGRGSASVQGKSVTIEWKTQSHLGTHLYNLDETCSSGSGTMTIRTGAGGNFSSTIRRLTTAPGQRAAVAAASPSQTLPSPQTSVPRDEALLGSWRGCDGRVIQFTLENGEYVGRYTSVGQMPVFTPGEIGYRAKALGSGRYSGQVKWRWTDGRSEWRNNTITISDSYSDTGSDDCSRNMTRVGGSERDRTIADASTQRPTGETISPNTQTTRGVAGRRTKPGGVCGIAGEWEQKVGDATTKYTFTPAKDGGYGVTQIGGGQVTGTATVKRSTLHIDWRAYTGLGVDEYELDAECSSGTGSSGFTTGEHAGPARTASIRRLRVDPELGITAAASSTDILASQTTTAMATPVQSGRVTAPGTASSTGPTAPAVATIPRTAIPDALRNPDGTARGDWEGDNRYTARDAEAALKMSVGNLPVDMNLDIDKDGSVLSADSRKILQEAPRMIDRSRSSQEG